MRTAGRALPAAGRRWWWWLVVCALWIAWPGTTTAMRADRIAELRRETVRMFYHGYDNYMRVAFPEDELRPVSCTPLTRDTQDPDNLALNDALGNFSLTLIDSLSTLAVLASAPAADGAVGAKALGDFQDGVAALVQQYGDGSAGPAGQGLRGRGFDLDSKVQVFETVIRAVGGLLSAHLFAAGELPMTGYDATAKTAWSNGLRYDGQLLRLALDLGARLLPAFYSATGMPYPRVNLRHGIPFYTKSPLHGQQGGRRAAGGAAGGADAEITETCSAGAGSLVLEFSVLSRLTGDQRFEQAAKRAFWAVWYRRSNIGLIGAGVDAEQGRWIGPYSVIGAGADSFFEYALKAHILLSGQGVPNRTQAAGGRAAWWPATAPWLDPNELFPALSAAEEEADAFLEAWQQAHAAIKRHLYSDREHPHYVNVNLWTGSLAGQWIDSLGAYYGGLLVLGGELHEAVATHLLYVAVWARYAALPERWSLRDKTVEGGLGWWPLRPEFVESTYHLFRATRDPWYLYVGEMVQRDIGRRCRTACGWAGLQNVLDGAQSDRMESFFLGETTKYMYLLYDDRHPLHTLDAAYVFSTEGHPLILPRALRAATAVPRPDDRARLRDTYMPADAGFLDTCPVPPRPAPLTGSAVTARSDMYHAPRVLGLPDGDDGGDQRRHDTTLFPWTLPPSMLPSDGMCALVQEPIEMSLEFAAATTERTGGGNGGGGSNGHATHGAGPGHSAFNFLLSAPTLDRVAHDKLRVLSVAGLKLVLRMEAEGGERQWRVTRVNGIPLGRDESLVLDRALVAHISDARFRLVRDPVVVKLHHLHEEEEEREGEREDDDEDDDEDEKDHDGRSEQHNHTLDTLSTLRAFWRQIVSSLDGPRATALPGWRRTAARLTNRIGNATGITATGPGVAPLPPVDVPAGAVFPATGAVPHELLPWTAVYAGGDACDGLLPETAARDHQVLVLRRGGCSFSAKLAAVPAFVPGPRSLQLVVVVSDDDDVVVAPGGSSSNSALTDRRDEANTFHTPADAFVRPLLDTLQHTPGGLPRRHPLAMIMVGGGEAAYAALAAARQLGLTRRYTVESQGVRVHNVLIDDGDAVL